MLDYRSLAPQAHEVLAEALPHVGDGPAMRRLANLMGQLAPRGYQPRPHLSQPGSRPPRRPPF